MEKAHESFIDSWPIVKFEEIQKVEIESTSARILYKSIFTALFLPQKTAEKFFSFIKHNPPSLDTGS